MPRPKELDDYAEAAAQPDAARRPEPDAGSVKAMTARELAQVLESAQSSELESAGDVHDDTWDEGPAEAHACYAEYLRMLDDVPVLSDVVDEPPRVHIRDFRRGERPDFRKRPREDSYTVREAQMQDVEQRYAEYVEALARDGVVAQRGASKSSRKKSRAKRPKRSKGRKRSLDRK